MKRRPHLFVGQPLIVLFVSVKDPLCVIAKLQRNEFCQCGAIVSGRFLDLLVRRCKEIGTETSEGRVKGLDEDKRKRFFHQNYRTLIPKEIEDRFFARIMDKDYIIRYVSLYAVEVTEGICWVIRGFLWNPDLLDHYWELTEAETK